MHTRYLAQMSSCMHVYHLACMLDLPVAADQYKTVFITSSLGLYEFKVMPLGSMVH